MLLVVWFSLLLLSIPNHVESAGVGVGASSSSCSAGGFLSFAFASSLDSTRSRRRTLSSFSPPMVRSRSRIEAYYHETVNEVVRGDGAKASPKTNGHYSVAKVMMRRRKEGGAIVPPLLSHPHQQHHHQTYDLLSLTTPESVSYSMARTAHRKHLKLFYSRDEDPLLTVEGEGGGKSVEPAGESGSSSELLSPSLSASSFYLPLDSLVNNLVNTRQSIAGVLYVWREAVKPFLLLGVGGVSDASPIAALSCLQHRAVRPADVDYASFIKEEEAKEEAHRLDTNIAKGSSLSSITPILPEDDPYLETLSHWLKKQKLSSPPLPLRRLPFFVFFWRHRPKCDEAERSRGFSSRPWGRSQHIPILAPSFRLPPRPTGLPRSYPQWRRAGG